MLSLPGRCALKARWVFPVAAAPLRDGVVAFDGRHIVSVAADAPGDCETIDLGNVALLPGLVNAHAHLDFSDLSTPLGRAGMPLPEWLELVVRQRRQEPPEASTERRRAAVALGYRESVARGTTTLGDIMADDESVLADGSASRELFFNEGGLDYTGFLELIGLSPERGAAQEQRLAAWLSRAGALGAASDGRWRFAVSPHAPYTVRPSLLEAVLRVSSIHRLSVAMHLAESREEIELLAQGEGPMVEALTRLGAWDAEAIPRDTRPLDYLERLAFSKSLIIHGNYLDAQERRFLGAHASNMGIVYCPRTHEYFGHDPYPLANLLTAGACVALGTDGRGSNPDLSILAEMRHVARHHPAVPLASVLQLGTLAGARALGCDHVAGSLIPGRDANMIAVPLPPHEEGDPHRLLLVSTNEVQMTIYRGRVVYDSAGVK